MQVGRCRHKMCGTNLVCEDSTGPAVNYDRLVHPKVRQHKPKLVGGLEDVYHADYVVLVPDLGMRAGSALHVEEVRRCEKEVHWTGGAVM